jgi:hypothetical protein
MADLTLKVGQSSIATVSPVEADGTTITPGASLSNVVWTISDPSITTAVNPDNSLSIAAVSPTATDVTGTVAATATDSDGTTGAFTATFTVSVSAPTGRTAGLKVSFSPPTP